MSNRIVGHCFDVSMLYSFQMLTEIARKQEKIDLAKLKPGEFVMFLNSAMTAFKMVGANNCMIYHRNPSNGPLNLRALTLLPHFYDGQSFHYDRALKTVLVSEMKKRNIPVVSKAEDVEIEAPKRRAHAASARA